MWHNLVSNEACPKPHPKRNKNPTDKKHKTQYASISVAMEFKTTNHPANMLSPIRKLNPNHNGSNLLDSYELKAIAKQLNRAISASNGLSTTPSYLKSPFYLHQLNRIYKENSKPSKKISSSKQKGVEYERTTEAKGARALVICLWKKVKRQLVRGNRVHC